MEGMRTKLVYDSYPAMKSSLFHHILPAFSSKKLFIAVYSDTIHRRFEMTYEFIVRKSPELAELLDKATSSRLVSHLKEQI